VDSRGEPPGWRHLLACARAAGQGVRHKTGGGRFGRWEKVCAALGPRGADASPLPGFTVSAAGSQAGGSAHGRQAPCIPIGRSDETAAYDAGLYLACGYGDHDDLPGVVHFARSHRLPRRAGGHRTAAASGLQDGKADLDRGLVVSAGCAAGRAQTGWSFRRCSIVALITVPISIPRSQPRSPPATH
jgi:hypothetical protein